MESKVSSMKAARLNVAMQMERSGCDGMGLFWAVGGNRALRQLSGASRRSQICDVWQMLDGFCYRGAWAAIMLSKKGDF
jgi:hypothetical protein